MCLSGINDLQRSCDVVRHAHKKKNKNKTKHIRLFKYIPADCNANPEECDAAEDVLYSQHVLVVYGQSDEYG